MTRFLPALLLGALLLTGCDAAGVSSQVDAKVATKGSDLVITGPGISGYYDFFRFFNPQETSPTVTSIGQVRADFSTNFPVECSGFFHLFDVFADGVKVATVESNPDNDEIVDTFLSTSFPAPVTFERDDPNDLTQGRVVIGGSDLAGPGGSQAFLGDVYFVASWGIAGGGGTDCRTDFALTSNTVKH